MIKEFQGRFLVLEGPDGTGKTTQALRLAEWLQSRGLATVHLRDPGTTRVGEKIRAILLDRENSGISPMTETLLFMAARSQLVAERIRPALEEGHIVICERWVMSTVCYQGYGGGLDPEEIWQLGEIATAGIRPDLTVVLDVDPARGLARLSGEPDLMESRSLEFHERVRTGYLDSARSGRMRSRLLASGTLLEVEERIREAVNDVV